MCLRNATLRWANIGPLSLSLISTQYMSPSFRGRPITVCIRVTNLYGISIWLSACSKNQMSDYTLLDPGPARRAPPPPLHLKKKWDLFL